MTFNSLTTVFRAFQDARAQYLVVGGVAVNAHGYQRVTQDLDVVLRMTADNIAGAMNALSALGYRPLVPVQTEDFADAVKRQNWIDEKHMTVFSLISDIYRDLTVDVFVQEPFEFEREYDEAMEAEIVPGLNVRFAQITTLIAMKEATGRARDQDDAQHLRMILQLKEQR